MRILFVCTANICRSASAEWLLREAIAACPALTGIEIRSAGTHAIEGAPGCSMAPALVGDAADHRSTQLTPELVAGADLILTAARDHRSAVALLEPAARARTFTIRQAGRIAAWMLEAGIVEAGRERRAAEASGTAVGWADQFAPGDPRADVPALPADLDDRWRWLVGELDAARGMAQLLTNSGDQASPGNSGPEAATAHDGVARSEASHGGTARPWTAEPGTAGSSVHARGGGPGSASEQRAPGATSTGASLGRWLHRIPRGAPRGSTGGDNPDDIRDPDDVPDPHVHGAGLHGVAYDQLRESTEALVPLLREVDG